MSEIIDALIVDINALFGLLVGGNYTNFCMKYAEIMQLLVKLRDMQRLSGEVNKHGEG